MIKAGNSVFWIIGVVIIWLFYVLLSGPIRYSVLSMFKNDTSLEKDFLTKNISENYIFALLTRLCLVSFDWATNKRKKQAQEKGDDRRERSKSNKEQKTNENDGNRGSSKEPNNVIKDDVKSVLNTNNEMEKKKDNDDNEEEEEENQDIVESSETKEEIDARKRKFEAEVEKAVYKRLKTSDYIHELRRLRRVVPKNIATIEKLGVEEFYSMFFVEEPEDYELILIRYIRKQKQTRLNGSLNEKVFFDYSNDVIFWPKIKNQDIG